MAPLVNEPMADTRDMYMAHAGLRREFRLLPGLIRSVEPGDTRRAEVVGSHAALMCDVLHGHHEGEDLLLWPKLVERGGAAAAAIVPAMEAQHHTIDALYVAATGLLGGWRFTGRGGEALAEAFDELLAVLEEHMALEEKEVLPLAEKHITAKEWHQLGEHGMEGLPKNLLPLVFGLAMYEGDPEVIKGVLAAAPLPVRLLVPVIGRRKYAAHAKRVHGTATPPRVGTA
ncbi:hemerythrin domain-containing protein [Streptomyces sp. ME01-24h]|nr:hemerythrin domain-containing protein [Streptomyces sp. ME19-03-3]MDX3351902.1 hemerythrin domain-containing protein [Streptomyces sp. ME01-24h]MDX3351951.1 hemerythrin domain-containing protein [Streptomyces sp. ME01-24h]